MLPTTVEVGSQRRSREDEGGEDEGGEDEGGEDEGGEDAGAAALLQEKVGRFMLQHVVKLVAQPRFVERRVELAALLLENACPN